jgi:hypothetical protein
MDKRKIQQIESNRQLESGGSYQITVDDIINSKKVNEVLLDNVEQLFELEFTLK